MQQLEQQMTVARTEVRKKPRVELQATPGPTGSALTMIAPIREGHVEDLRRYLTGIGSDIRNNPDFVADELATVHFLRWLIVPKGAGASRDYLAFESNYDGTLNAHLDDLLRAGARAIHRMYQHCEGYPVGGSELADSDFEKAKAYLSTGSIPYAAFYRANPHKTAKRVVLEGQIRDAIETFLDAKRPELVGLPKKEIYSRIREHVRALKLLDTIETVPMPRPPRESMLQLALRLLPTAIPLLFLLPVIAPLLLLKELTDATWSPKEGSGRSTAVSNLKELEDRLVQNQLSHFVPVKAGILRRYVLRNVLHTIDTLAHHYFNQGELGGIPTIHFARWAFLEEDHLLLFYSNYDGSWENYLGDFIDIAAVGLTSVWSNTKKFPRTLCLVGKGARDEERFKSWTRAHQLETQIWYSAYPKLSVKNTLKNAAIAEGLVKPPTDERALEDFLALL